MNTANLILQGDALEVLAHAASLMALAKEVSTKTSNVRRSHGSAAHLGRAAADLGANNVNTRAMDIDNLAIVGEVANLVVLVAGTNSADRRLGSRRDVSGIFRRVLRTNTVTSRDSNEEALLDHVGDSLVDEGRLGATQAHVDDSAVGAVTALVVLGNVVQSLDGSVVRALTLIRFGVVGKDLDSEQLGLLGNTVRLAANGSGNVCAVAALIARALDERREFFATVFKVLISLVLTSQ